MAYDTKFYDAYQEYLQEEEVRKAHDWVLKIVTSNYDFQKIVDFGCGLNEFLVYTAGKGYGPSTYLGVDINAAPPNIKLDYRGCDLRALLTKWELSAFVSLFSTEITGFYEDNYRFYEKVFKETSVKFGLVSGFYYSGQKDRDIIHEVGGISSYQTLENIESVQSLLFSEKRIILPVPSKMFGNNVFEVWKIFERR